jgi:pilus assembly protein CpaB
MRAMSVIVTSASAVGGWLYPGCLVDVVAAVRVPTARGGSTADVLSTVLLQGVEVLAVGTQSIVSAEEKTVGGQIKDNRKEVVTLMVDAKQAEALHLAAVQGDITLTLRNPLDKTATQDRGLRLAQLSGENPEGDRVVAIEALPPLLPGGNESAPPAVAIDPGLPLPPVTINVEQPEAAPLWRMLLIRGKKQQVLEFEETEQY